MSTKGTSLSPITREKIALSKTKHTKSHLINKGIEYINTFLDENEPKSAPPSIVGYCLHAGISRSRLYELQATIPELSDTIEYIEMLQEAYALNQGFNGKSPIFAMFLLKSKQNYHDSPQALTQNNYLNISPELLSDALQLMKESKK